MKRKVIRVLCIIGVVISLVSTAAIAVSACSAGMGRTKVTISIGWFGSADTAKAEVNRCACDPIDNHLKAMLQVQYKVGNENKNAPTDTSMFYYREGTKVETISVSYQEHYIQWANAEFYGTCGNYPEVRVAKSVTR